VEAEIASGGFEDVQEFKVEFTTRTARLSGRGRVMNNLYEKVTDARKVRRDVIASKDGMRRTDDGVVRGSRRAARGRRQEPR
jgi:hypothetical protein